MDICGYIPHAPVHVYVMGQRGADREPATAEDLRRMASIVREAVAAGAMGFSTSRTFFHRSSDGKSTPSFEAAEDELMALAGALRDANTGAMQLITDFDDPEAIFGLLRRMVERAGRPLSVSLLEGTYGPMTLRWRDILDWAAQAGADGLPIKAQVLSRAIGVMLGHELTLNTFAARAAARSGAVNNATSTGGGSARLCTILRAVAAYTFRRDHGVDQRTSRPACRAFGRCEVRRLGTADRLMRSGSYLLAEEPGEVVRDRQRATEIDEPAVMRIDGAVKDFLVLAEAARPGVAVAARQKGRVGLAPRRRGAHAAPGAAVKRRTSPLGVRRTSVDSSVLLRTKMRGSKLWSTSNSGERR